MGKRRHILSVFICVHLWFQFIMLLKITHETHLDYSEPVSEAVMELRMAPRQEQDQRRLSFNLAIGPQTSAASYFDWMGNTVHTFSISAFHRAIRIIATSVVETHRHPQPLEWFGDRWPIADGACDHTVYDFLQFGGPVVQCPMLRDLAGSLDPHNGIPIGDLARRMLDLINDKFQYQQGVTTAASPITEILAHGQGVCQDFTHLLIGLARTLKIPARYVSGLLHPDEKKYRGYTQTHAWCELLFPSIGWVGIDPTNRCLAGDNFVKVAVGRDYRDVPPNRGLYRGTSSENITVKIHSEQLTTIPAELAAERMQNLDVPYYLDEAAAHQEIGVQHQQSQQQ